MLTTEEIRAIPLFSTLGRAELELLAQTSADLRLGAGEYAVHEGGPERALFAVLAGKMQVVRLIDGVERTLGWRTTGTIFGEIPIAIGLPFYAGYRASEPSRVMRVEARQYFAIAAASQEISLKVSALARERIGGMQGISAEAPKPLVTLLGDRWDPACAEVRRFLARNQIVFDWAVPDSPALSTLWPGPAPKPADCPMLRLADGTVLTHPQARELAQRLGLQTSARLAEYDTVIVGGGPAGLAAAVYGASEGLRTLCIEREAPGGQAGTSSRIENYLDFPTASQVMRLRAARCSRRSGSGPRPWSRALSPASIRRRAMCCWMARRRSVRGPSSWPPASSGGA